MAGPGEWLGLGPDPSPAPMGVGGRVPQSSLLGLGQAYVGALGPPPRNRQKYLHSNTVQLVVTLYLSHLEGTMCSSPTPSGTVSHGPPCAVERVERSPGRQAGSLRWPMATAVRDLLLPSGASAETAAPGSWLHPRCC